MGCFSTCFRKSKRRRSRKPTNPTPCSDQFRYECVEAVQPADFKEQENTETLIGPNPESIDDEQNEELSVSGRKKVAFDLNVHFYDKLPAKDENHGNEEEEEEEKTEEGEKEKESNGSSSSQIPFPNNYRYQNCRDSDDDEFDDEMLSYDDSDHDYMGDDEDEESEIEVSNDSLVGSDESSPSSSMEPVNEKLASLNSGTPIQVKDTKITNEIKGFESVLHPVENLSQWKEIRGMAKLEPQNDEAAKENNMHSEPVMKPNLTNKKTKSKNSCEEMMAVDTSLSCWLNTTPSKSRANSVSVGNSPCSGGKSYSAKDYEDRPILGVLTVEEIRQFSATSTPRRSPTRSPDDMPIIGSVGSYWN
ncbi:hypothetical protein V2J09_001203 [Rumex salicifolius]